MRLQCIFMNVGRCRVPVVGHGATQQAVVVVVYIFETSASAQREATVLIMSVNGATVYEQDVDPGC